jgi:hypothetical protein
MKGKGVKQNITTILLVVLCGYETLSLSFREEEESRVFGKKLLGREYIWNYDGKNERKEKNIQ